MPTLSSTVQSISGENHAGDPPQPPYSNSIGGRPVCNLRFADDIDLMGGSSKELQDLTNSLVAKAGDYGMEVSTEKSKVMVNSTNNISTNINMNGEQLEEVISFKYFGATLSKDGTCTAEIRNRIYIISIYFNDLPFHEKV